MDGLLASPRRSGQERFRAQEPSALVRYRTDRARGGRNLRYLPTPPGRNADLGPGRPADGQPVQRDAEIIDRLLPDRSGFDLSQEAVCSAEEPRHVPSPDREAARRRALE